MLTRYSSSRIYQSISDTIRMCLDYSVPIGTPYVMVFRQIARHAKNKYILTLRIYAITKDSGHPLINP